MPGEFYLIGHFAFPDGHGASLTKARSGLSQGTNERFSMLTNQKIIDAINEPAFAEATAWQPDRDAGLNSRNSR
jgi:hypothetical protein